MVLKETIRGQHELTTIRIQQIAEAYVIETKQPVSILVHVMTSAHGVVHVPSITVIPTVPQKMTKKHLGFVVKTALKRKDRALLFPVTTVAYSVTKRSSIESTRIRIADA